MKVTIKCDNSYDFISLETNKVCVHPLEIEVMYVRFTDKKWIKFAKKHGFNPNKDCHVAKIWDLYLRLCAEGMVEDAE